MFGQFQCLSGRVGPGPGDDRHASLGLIDHQLDHAPMLGMAERGTLPRRADRHQTFDPALDLKRHVLPQAGFLNLALSGRNEVRPQRLWGRTIFHVDDVDAQYETALNAGFSPEAPPADAEWGERYFHLRDPDGHELSFAKVLEG